MSRAAVPDLVARCALIRRRRTVEFGAGLVAALALAVGSAAAREAESRWKAVAPLPEPRWFHASGVDARGRVYVFGGDIFRNRQQETGGRLFGLVYFDPARGEWARAPEPPSLHSTLRRLIFSNSGNRAELTEMKPTAFYDQDEHRYEGPIPFYRRMAASTATGPDGRIWMLGGWAKPWGPEPPGPRRKRELDHFGVLSSLEVYDPVANTYTERAPMHQPRWLFAACFGSDGKLYAFGGFGAASGMKLDESDPENERKRVERSEMAREALRSVEAYDPETDSWSPRAALPEPRQNMAAALGGDGRIYVIGGIPAYVEADNAQTSVFVYDPAKDRWSRGPSLRTERQGHTAVATKEGLIYAIGGRNSRSSFNPAVWLGGENGPLASVEVLDTRPR